MSNQNKRWGTPCSFSSFASTAELPEEISEYFKDLLSDHLLRNKTNCHFLHRFNMHITMDCKRVEIETKMSDYDLGKSIIENLVEIKPNHQAKEEQS